MTNKSKSQKVFESGAKAAGLAVVTTGVGALIDKGVEAVTGKKSNIFTAIGTGVGTIVGAAVGFAETADEFAEADSSDGEPV